MTNKEARQRKKLLVLTSTFPRWKGDREPPFVYELCRRLAKDFDVLVLAPHAKGSHTNESLDNMRIHRYRYFIESWELLAYQGGILANLKRNKVYYLLVPFFLISQALAVSKLLRREKFDAVHAHWIIPQGLAGIMSGFLSGKKFPALICTSHGSDLLGLRGPIFRSLKRMVLQRSDAVTVVSHALKEHALIAGAAYDKLSSIPMGVDAHKLFSPSPNNRRATNELLFVGRLVASKSVNTLIEAMPSILDLFPQVSLTIVGDGPERKKLEHLAEFIGVSSRVKFLGAIENSELPKLYQRATVFASSSLSEGFGLTLCEAAACECPIIAPDLLACRQIIIDGETGLLTPPGNSPSLAEKVLELLANPDRRQLLGHAGRKLVLAKYDWQVIVPKYARIFETMASA